MTTQLFRAKHHRQSNNLTLAEVAERVAVLGAHSAEQSARMEELEQRQTSMSSKHEQLRRFVMDRAGGAA